MQRLEVSGEVRLIYKSLGVKGLIIKVVRGFLSLRTDLELIRQRPP